MVRGLLNLVNIEERCTNYLTGKQHRDIIPKHATWRAGAKTKLVHYDICGPIKPKSFGINMYFMIFIGDYTRNT